jgi:two-component system response regulator AtoC
MKNVSILIADDDPSLRSFLARFLISKGYITTAAASGDEAIAQMKGQPTPDLVLLDVMMPGTDGLDVLAHMKKLRPEVPVIILSGVGHIKTVVEAIRLGAADYLLKPFEEEALELTIQNALEKLKLRDEVNELRRRLAEPEDSDLSVSCNSKMVRVHEIARQVAETDVPVLITGESGVGKEVLSRYIHAHSGRADQPYVKVNCAALPHDLLESELFGYERGAFTGALTDKPGKFELAGKGTLVLDEIGEMSPILQAKLLHVLQDNEYSRLGGKRVVKVHARILASTNRKLEQSVARGEFRQDLYFRLNVIAIEIPPLRERREDIPLLCMRFVDKYREKYKSPVLQLPQDLMESFTRSDWPGNIRQLENTIKRYLILPDSDLMLSSATGRTGQSPSPEQTIPVSAPEHLDLKEIGAVAAERAEKELVLRTLDQTRWNRKTTARILNISYKGLRNKLKKWQVSDKATSLPYEGLTLPREVTL